MTKYVNITLLLVSISGGSLAYQAEINNAEAGFQARKPADRKLLDACKEGNLELAHQAIAEGANVNFRIGNTTPLQLASTFLIDTKRFWEVRPLPSPALVRLLLAYGADPFVRFHSLVINEWTILFQAKFYLSMSQRFSSWGGQGNVWTEERSLLAKEIIQILEKVEVEAEKIKTRLIFDVGAYRPCNQSL